MVEGGNQLGLARQEHAIAEDVARHVATADRGEGLALDIPGAAILADLPEVTLHRLPGAARRDAHGLVVVTGRTARGEGIVEPELLRLGDGIGRVGEGRRALVGRDDEIGIVAVIAPDPFGAQQVVAGDVVGDRQERGDEDHIGRLAAGKPGVAIRGVGQLLGIEAAFGADRHDDRVLHLLGLDEAENLGPIVLGPVRPAQTATGDLSETQMDTLDPRIEDEDLTERDRRRKPLDAAALEFEGERRLDPSRLCGQIRSRAVDREIVGAQGRQDRVQKAADDAIVVDRIDIVETFGDCLENIRDAAHCRPAGLPVLDVAIFGVARLRASALGIEGRFEQRIEFPGKTRLPGQRLGDIVRRIGQASLS